MIVDISHVSDKTFYDVLAVSSKPVIASHSSCFVYSDIPRNMKDDMFRALAKNGGVVGVNFGSSFLNQKDAEELKQRIAKHNDVEVTDRRRIGCVRGERTRRSGEIRSTTGAATVEDAAECIDHIANRWC